MTGLTKSFQWGEYVGILQRFNPNRGAFDKALYLSALGNVYPHVRIDLKGDNEREIADNLMSGLSIVQLGGIGIWEQVNNFIDLAVHVKELHGLGFEWPTAKAAPEHIDQAFNHFLDEPDFWEFVKAECERLDNPNGVEGKPKRELTPQEIADPKS